jgi:SSS family transporter
VPNPISALAFFATPPHLRATDLTIVAAYLIGITLFGLHFREKSADPGARSLRSYFLANNTIPWWAISLSIVSAETSTLTIISIPGVAFAGDFGFLQVVLGYMLGRIVVAALFLPRYFSGNMLTAYQLIDQRFGSSLHKVTAGLFLLTRAAAEGVRVFAVSIVVGIAIGTRDVLSIAIISALTLLYTFEGGMAAVIWTDVVQMFIYVGGTIVAIWSLGQHIPGGWTTIHTIASAAGKFHMLNFAFNLTTTYTFWAGILGGTFLTMASHGTDQLMVQRMLAARNLRESRLALLSSGVVIFIQFALFLLIGAGLYVFYKTPGPWALNPAPSFSSADRIFPTFIVREMPLGIAGLLVAAILAAAMSNLSAALNSLSSTTVVDFYMHLRPNADDRERNLISKSSTVLWAIVLFAIAVYSLSVGGKGHVVEIGLSIASVAYGCLLGVFLLGTLTKFATQTGATIGMLCGFLLNLWIWQGIFPVHLGPLTIPHIAWTWYVIIGATATFAIGSLFSLIFSKQSKRTAAATAAVFIAVILSGASRLCDAQSKDPDAAHPSYTVSPLSTSNAAPPAPWALGPGPSSTAPDFAPITTLIDTAIAAHKLPGAVVLIGHNNHIVFEQAYGDRKLANQPGLDGQPSPAEPMTADTIFDMASLSKCLSTATAIMQLYEAGKITSFDDPISKYLPEFLAATDLKGQRPTSYQPGATPQVTGPDAQRAEGPTHNPVPGNANPDPRRALVTLRMLLTHTSGEAPDVDLKSPWGLSSPDKAEGLHLALTTPLKSVPGDHFEYSDINFILLGHLVKILSGEPLDVYAQDYIFKPLNMYQTAYHPFANACGTYQTRGSAIFIDSSKPMAMDQVCFSDAWTVNTIFSTAPTAHDNEGTATTNPDFDHLLRGTVHDPTTRRMGGVAGHAGVFSTAYDVSLFASALLEKLLHNTGPFPLKQSTLQLMTSPQQPGHTPHDLADANTAQQSAASSAPPQELSSQPERSAVERSAAGTPAAPGLAPHYPAIKGRDIHALGWDIDTAFSKPRGSLFPIGSFGHTGFTGTSLWMDPASNTYVILLANAIHPRGGNGPISNLRGQIATATADALGLAAPCPTTTVCHPERSAAEPKDPKASNLPTTVQNLSAPNLSGKTLTGIDVLESTGESVLLELAAEHKNLPRQCFGKKCFYTLRYGLLTNQTGVDSRGLRTIDFLNSTRLREDHLDLTTLFSPEHGIFGREDTEHFAAETDPATHLHVISLFGPTDADKRPSHDQLKDLDAVVIDLQDAGVRFWTYEAATAYFLEAASREQTEFHHDLKIILLDRPNPLGGLQVQGPVSDPSLASYIDYMPLPVRHGLTLGELCRYIVATKHLATHLTVVPMQHWRRTDYFADTGVPWISPSPNLRSLNAATLYPALGFLDYTNVSVGRGTDTPFELFAASWLHAPDVVAALTDRHIPGVTFTATTTTVAEDVNDYPFHGQTIPAIHISLTDRNALDSPELGVEILSVLHRLYPAQFKLDRTLRLLGSRATLEALQRGDDPHSISLTWATELDQFKSATAPYLLYK